MSNEQEIIEEELTEEEEQLKYDKEYDAVFLDEENEAPIEEEVEEPEVTEEEEPVEETPPTDQPAQPPTEAHKIRWNGQDVEVSMDELTSMAQQGFDYTYKSQQLAEEKRGYQSDLDLLTKVKSGDKDALATLSKTSGIDPLDILDIDVSHVEQGSVKPDLPFMSPEVGKLMDEVQKDSELYEKMQYLEPNIPNAVVDVMAKDASVFYSIVGEVRNGDAMIVLPKVTARLAALPELDRALVINNPEQYKNLYLSVKQGLINEHQAKANNKQAEHKPKPNLSEVGITRSGQTKRVPEGAKDSMSNDKEYQAILERLRSQ